VPDGDCTLKPQQVTFSKDLRHQSHICMDMNLPALSRGNASAFLSTVL
jgi:hypothetical protein